MEKPREKSHARFTLLLVLGFVVAVAAALVTIWKSSLENRAADLKTAIAYVKSETSFARFRILSRDASGMRVELTLLDLAGDAVAQKEIALPGADFFLEARVVLVREGEATRAFVFPFRAYSDVLAPADGIDLLALYVKDGVPASYGGKEVPEGVSRTARRLYQAAFLPENTAGRDLKITIVKIFDTSVHQSALEDFRVGRGYRCVAHPAGGVELREEE